MKAAPTLPTLDTTEEGVEKMPVPMIRPILWLFSKTAMKER